MEHWVKDSRQEAEGSRQRTDIRGRRSDVRGHKVFLWERLSSRDLSEFDDFNDFPYALRPAPSAL